MREEKLIPSIVAAIALILASALGLAWFQAHSWAVLLVLALLATVIGLFIRRNRARNRV